MKPGLPTWPPATVKYAVEDAEDALELARLFEAHADPEVEAPEAHGAGPCPPRRVRRYTK